jgi:hypothetical protein
MDYYDHFIGEKRHLLFAGPEAPQHTEKTTKAQEAEKQAADPQVIDKQRAERRAKVQAAEKENRATEEAEEEVIARRIEAQPSEAAMRAIARLEGAYRNYARGGSPVDPSIVMPMEEAVRREWTAAQPGPERRAIVDALNAACERACAGTPYTRWYATDEAGDLEIRHRLAPPAGAVPPHP